MLEGWNEVNIENKHSCTDTFLGFCRFAVIVLRTRESFERPKVPISSNTPRLRIHVACSYPSGGSFGRGVGVLLDDMTKSTLEDSHIATALLKTLRTG